MAERKVLNKYYPPDFDPSKLRRFEKKTVRKMCNVRMMLPMSVRCYTCQNYMYIGTKFNMKVETVKDEDYLGIKIYRFYFKCTQCYAEITFKTDPKNHDYVAEWGASRNHEQWKDMLMAEEEFKEIKQSEMKEDAMKSLEHRTYDSKREMDILDALDQVKNLNRRQAVINYDELIEKAVQEKDRESEKLLVEKEKQEAKEIFQKRRERRIEDYNNLESSNGTGKELLGNKSQRDEDSDDRLEKVDNTLETSKNQFLKITPKEVVPSFPKIMPKIKIQNKKQTLRENNNPLTKTLISPNKNNKPNFALNLLKAYDDENNE